MEFVRLSGKDSTIQQRQAVTSTQVHDERREVLSNPIEVDNNLHSNPSSLFTEDSNPPVVNDVTTATATPLRREPDPINKKPSYSELFKKNAKYKKEFDSKIDKKIKAELSSVTKLEKKWNEKKRSALINKLQSKNKTSVDAQKTLISLVDECTSTTSACKTAYDDVQKEVERLRTQYDDCMEYLLTLTRTLHSKLEAVPGGYSDNFRYKSDPIIYGSIRDSPFPHSANE